MARQLIFTSSPQGLEPGRTGYCTVARHKDLRNRLVRELERLSVYDFNQQGEGPKVEIATYRKLALGSEDYFVVSRIRDAGLDYTNRTNYIAHHLILDSFEIASVPSPAEILANWNGWLAKWEGPARYLTEAEEADLSVCKSPNLIPANGWLAATNDPGNAATLVSPQVKKPVVLDVNPGQEESLLKLFAESCALIKLSLDAWDYPFTTFLQENEDSRGYAWIGSRGHPAGERAKQAAPNLIDLRDFSQSKITDPVDDDLAHVARKGPKAKAAGAKSPKTRAKAPGKAFSDREMAQYKQAASSYVSAGAAAPVGSTVAAPQTPGGSSSGKEQKKRPWLMQLIVISTALCLLVGLVVGVAYNLDDWLADDTPEPPGGSGSVTPPPDSGPSPVVANAALNIGEAGTVKLLEKHRLLRYLKLDVGEPGGAPLEVTVNLTDDQQDAYLDLLEGVSPGDPIQVTVVKNGDDTLGFETIQKAPLGTDVLTPPDLPAGEPEEVAFTGSDSVTLQGDQASFELPGRGSVAYVIPDDRPEERVAVEALVAFVRENPTAAAPIRLFRDEDGAVVGIGALDLPASGSIVEPVKPQTVGVAREVTVNDTRAVSYINNGKSLAIRVGARTLSYAIPTGPEEAERVRRLITFLEAGGKDVKLDLRVEGDVVRSLAFDLAEEAVAALTTGPVALVPSATYVFWLPGRKPSETSPRWELDLPRTGAVRYENPQLATKLFEALSASAALPEAQAWRAPFIGPRAFYKVAENADAFEPYALQMREDLVDRENQARFSLKSTSAGGSYFLELNVRRNGFIEADLDYTLAKTAAEQGFVLRFPRDNETCIDFHFLSNKHLSPDNGHLPAPRASQLALTGSTLRFDPSWPMGRNFHVLVRGTGREYELSIAPASGPGGEEPRDLTYAAGIPPAMAFIRGDVKGFPKAVISPNSADRFACEIKMEVEYMADLRKDFQRLKDHWEKVAQAEAVALPDSATYENLLKFGTHFGRPAFSPGKPYGPHLIDTVTGVAKDLFQLDDSQTETFRQELKVLDTQGFHLRQNTLAQFWRACFAEMRERAEVPFRTFRYDPERAERDVRMIFGLMEFSVFVERAFGLRDTDLARELKAFRESVSDVKEGGLQGAIRAKLVEIKDTVEGRKAIGALKESDTRYREVAEKSLPPPAKLNFSEYSKAMQYLGDATKEDGLKKRQAAHKNQLHWLSELRNKETRLSSRFNAVMAAGGSQVQSARSRLVSATPWALALFRKGKATPGTPAVMERVADIVTFR